MAWIESHQTIERHKKTKTLMRLMSWDLDAAIGKLHRFWWWCVDYAENGDLGKYNNDDLGDAVGLNGSESKKFVEAMVEAGWLDRTPYFRVHDWWEYIGPWLRSRYKRSPGKWEKVKELYQNSNVTVTQPLRNSQPDQPDQPTNQKHRFFDNPKFSEVFTAYLEMRKKIRKQATDHAIGLILKDLEKYDIKTAIKMLEQSIINSWQGVFPLKPVGGVPKPVLKKYNPDCEKCKGTGFIYDEKRVFRGKCSCNE